MLAFFFFFLLLVLPLYLLFFKIVAKYSECKQVSRKIFPCPTWLKLKKSNTTWMIETPFVPLQNNLHPFFHIVKHQTEFGIHCFHILLCTFTEEYYVIMLQVFLGHLFFLYLALCLRLIHVDKCHSRSFISTVISHSIRWICYNFSMLLLIFNPFLKIIYLKSY